LAVQTALITGASSGIGLHFAELFARDGVRPVLVARSGDKLHALAADIAARYGLDAVAIPLDLAQPGAAERLFEEVERRQIAVDALVNNAGFATYGLFADTSLAEEREELQLNVLTLTELTKLFLKPMLARGRGRILNVASTAGFQPGPYSAVYYASKSYVLLFSEALSNELEGTGVTATCLAPGATESGFQGRAGIGKSWLFNGRRVSDPAKVALAGYRAMQRGQSLVIPGIFNQISAFAPRLTPRKLVTRISRAFAAPRK
jgi:short-subunit dehydrogenase